MIKNNRHSLQILIVTTSHKSLGDATRDTGLWFQQLTDPYYVFKDAGECITIASPGGGGPIPVDAESESVDTITESTKRFRSDSQALYHLLHSLPLKEVKAADFDLIFITGGHASLIDLANNEILSSLLQDFLSKNNPIGAVGSGVVALLDLKNKNGSPFIKGKKVTAISNAEMQMGGLTYTIPVLLETQLLSLAAFYSMAPINKVNVVIDDNLVTGQNPASSIDTAKAVKSIACKTFVLQEA